MISDYQITDAVQTLALSAETLRELSPSFPGMEALLEWVSLITFRKKMGEDRPLLVGFIGCTGTGKSTLFNSLVGWEISITGWTAHNTGGPLLFVSDEFLEHLSAVEKNFGVLLFPALKRESVTIDPAACTAVGRNSEASSTSSDGFSPLVGSPGAAILVTVKPAVGTTSGDNHSPKERVVPLGLLFVDLPDINTTLAREEKLLAFELQPWLDAVIFVVDDETVYHRDYEFPARLAKDLRQSRVCVLNHRGRDRVELEHPDMLKVKEFFGVDTVHLLTEIRGKNRFESEPAFLRLREILASALHPAPETPLLERVAAQAKTVMEENQRRLRALEALEESLEETIDKRTAHEPTIPWEKLLPNEVLLILQHLGLKRFSLTNVGHWIKRIARTGSLRRSFSMVFGDRRGEDLTRMIHLDTDKLVKEVENRLANHREEIAKVLLHHPSVNDIPALTTECRKWLFTANASAGEALKNEERILSPELRKTLGDRAADFEKQCRELIANDTVPASVKNDPLVALAVLIALITDYFTIPGFGSWALMPTVFKYLPVGKFEKVKRGFQEAVREMIRQELRLIPGELHRLREKTVIEESSWLFHALRTCAEYKKYDD